MNKNYAKAMRNNSYKVYMSDDVVNELIQRGADQTVLYQLGAAIVNIPRNNRFIVDTSDDKVSIYGYPISFIRDHKGKTIQIMTNAEALALDAKVGDAEVKFSKDFANTLEKMGFDGAEDLETID